MLRVKCACGHQLEVPAEQRRKGGKCPACKRTLRVVASGPIDTSKVPDASLIVWSGPHRVGEQFVLAGAEPLAVGKLPGSDIRLPGDRVSRSHCSLTPEPTGWRIEDHDSTNGLFVNGNRVTEFHLYSGDRIKIGEYDLKYVSATSAGRPPSARPAGAGPVVETRFEPSPDAPSAPHPPTASAIPVRPAVPVATPKRIETDVASMPDDGCAIADDTAELHALAQGGEVIEPPPEGMNPELSAPVDLESPPCPSCERHLPKGACICVHCGINVKTGRSILTADEVRLEDTYDRAKQIIKALSWPAPVGLYPFASEAFGGRKPQFVRGLIVFIIAVSTWFYFVEAAHSTSMSRHKQLMLWSPRANVTLDDLHLHYESFGYFDHYGDPDAFEEKADEIAERDRELSEEQILIAAHQSLPLEQRCIGEYRWYQLVTHTLLHAGFWHLASNLLFLWVFGARINAVLGNLPTLVVYPILAVGAALVFLESAAGESPMPMIGASGAIMGLAGMYFVFFPLHRVHMAVWLRLLPLLALKMWPVRGFWVVLFYIGMDVFWIMVGSDSDIAYWAHLGGFMVGAGIALILLLTRMVNCNGGDLLSAILGRYAWALIGKPRRERGLLQRLP